MSTEPKLPTFDHFSRWLTQRLERPAGAAAHYETLAAAAREARDEFARAQGAARQSSRTNSSPLGPLEVLQLLAAADKSDATRPPEMTTARGFHVTLAYDDDPGTEAPSICVLVKSPPELIPGILGQTAYLWKGTERFELGQFDAEGKAIGLLPSGIEISVSDFAQGRVTLEGPAPSHG